jgi:arginine/serine-rich splicing factor 1/9
VGLGGPTPLPALQDVKYAIKKLDDAEFKNPFDKGFFMRLYDESTKEEPGDRDRDRRSRSKSRSRSRCGAARA